MAYQVSTPDLDNYIKRIIEIQRVIIPTSATTYTPRNGAGNYPYWVTLARTTSLNPINTADSRLTFAVDMLLIRGPSMSGYDSQLEAVLLADMMTITSYFMRYRNFVTATYPAIQSFYVPDSARLTRIERFDGQVQGDANVVGSFYTLEWQHRLVKDTTSISPP